MKTKRIISVLIISLIILTLFGSLVSCSNGKLGKQFVTYSYFNTTSTLVIYEKPKKAENIWTKVKELLSAIESKLDMDIEGSDVWNFNQSSGGELQIDKITYDVLSLSKVMYELTDGTFNPALGIYIDLWGFSPRFSAENYKIEKPYDREDYKNSLPEDKFISAFSSLVDFSQVTLEEREGKYYVIKPNSKVTIDGNDYTMMINLGGIGKGYATDVVTDFLNKEGYTYGYFSVGRSSLSLLNNPMKLKDSPIDNAWRVALVNPFENEKTYADVFCNQTSVSTSGDYENFYEYNQKRYSHIINPETFMPFDNNIASVTVMGKNASYCDALTTALCVMGKDKAISFSNEYLGEYSLAVVVIENGERVVFTKGMDNIFIKDHSILLKSWGEE